MEGNINGCKKEGEAGKEEERRVKKQAVILGMEIFDCSSCSDPLIPPIFECSYGHFICEDCHDYVPEGMCEACAGESSQRSYSMERVVESICVPCKHGCSNRITYYQKKKHEEYCSEAPCFCSESGCAFSGPKAALLKHFTTQHKWSITSFKYYKPFNFTAKPGLHILRAEDDHLFLLNVESLNSVVLTVSMVCVEPNIPEASFGCSLTSRWHSNKYQCASLDMITNSSLSRGPPKDYFCVVPNVCSEGNTGVLKRITITKMIDNEDELEEEDDDDGSYEDDSRYEEHEADDHSDA